MKTLQQTLTEEFGRNIIRRTELPDYLSLGLSRQLRPYQVECFRYLLTYLDNTFEGKARRPHLLFHMATATSCSLSTAPTLWKRRATTSSTKPRPNTCSLRGLPWKAVR